jgi:hypothetical protein
MAMGAGSTSMDDALRDALMVKAHDLFPANLVFKESRPDVVLAAGSQPMCAQVSKAIAGYDCEKKRTSYRCW